jgi:hypothetical protein
MKSSYVSLHLAAIFFSVAKVDCIGLDYKISISSLLSSSESSAVDASVVKSNFLELRQIESSIERLSAQRPIPVYDRPYFSSSILPSEIPPTNLAHASRLDTAAQRHVFYFNEDVSYDVNGVATTTTYGKMSVDIAKRFTIDVDPIMDLYLPVNSSHWSSSPGVQVEFTWADTANASAGNMSKLHASAYYGALGNANNTGLFNAGRSGVYGDFGLNVKIPANMTEAMKGARLGFRLTNEADVNDIYYFSVVCLSAANYPLLVQQRSLSSILPSDIKPTNYVFSNRTAGSTQYFNFNQERILDAYGYNEQYVYGDMSTNDGKRFRIDTDQIMDDLPVDDANWNSTMSTAIFKCNDTAQSTATFQRWLDTSAISYGGEFRNLDNSGKFMGSNRVVYGDFGLEIKFATTMTASMAGARFGFKLTNEADANDVYYFSVVLDQPPPALT